MHVGEPTYGKVLAIPFVTHCVNVWQEPDKIYSRFREQRRHFVFNCVRWTPTFIIERRASSKSLEIAIPTLDKRSSTVGNELEKRPWLFFCSLIFQRLITSNNVLAARSRSDNFVGEFWTCCTIDSVALSRFLKSPCIRLVVCNWRLKGEYICFFFLMKIESRHIV